jgi:hypothetical protein
MQAVGGRLEPVVTQHVERQVEISVNKSTLEKLRYVQALMSHSLPHRGASELLDEALDLLIAQARKRRLGSAVSRRGVSQAGIAEPGRPGRPGRREQGGMQREPRSRYIPLPIRRAVWERDQGQCTFVGPNGYRCATQRYLQFDHIRPFARGGKTTVEGLRLRCRAHNQLEAEREFGADLIRRKRERRKKPEPYER